MNLAWGLLPGKVFNGKPLFVYKVAGLTLMRSLRSHQSFRSSLSLGLSI